MATGAEEWLVGIDAALYVFFWRGARQTGVRFDGQRDAPEAGTSIWC